MVNMADEGEKMPIRLVQENGDTISLDATSIDIVVERIQSNFGIPFFNAKKMAIDVNQAAVAIEVQGVFADDVGQESTAKAVAKMDFYQPQQMVTWGNPSSGGGGSTSGPTSSSYNSTGSNSGQSAASTGIGAVSGGNGNWSGGIGSSFGGSPISLNDLGNRILKFWDGKHISLPVAYWVEEAAGLDNPVSSGLQLWLKADALSATHSHGDKVASWTDSSGNGRNAVQSTDGDKPLFKTGGINGNPYLHFISNDYLEIPFNAFLNTEEFTTIAVVRVPEADSGWKNIINNGTSTSSGFSLNIDVDSQKDFNVAWGEGSAIDEQSTAGSMMTSHDGHIVSATMDDTTGNGQSDTLLMYVDGVQGASLTSGIDYVPNTSAVTQISKYGSVYFYGEIYEILQYNRVLSLDEREQVEGYLSRKYNVDLAAGAYRDISNYNYDNRHLTIGFDKDMVPSRREPYGFLNIPSRPTDMFINGTPSSGGTVINVDDGSGSAKDPRTWFEISENNRNHVIEFRNPTTNQIREDSLGNEYYGIITALTSSQITVTLNTTSPSHADGDKICIRRINYPNSQLRGSDKHPVIIIPIKNADTYDENALPTLSIGPEFPNFQDGTARNSNHGTEYTRTDEYIAFLVSKALTGSTVSGDTISSYWTIGEAVDASGNKDVSNIFDVTIAQSFHGHDCRLTITQKYASSLGQLSDTIDSSLGIGQMPVIQGFSGGKSGKKVKSGGDKVQDIMGILANSANFVDPPSNNLISDILGYGLDFVQTTIYNDHKSKGDYIRGIQVPYNTLTTKGKSVFDAEIAQRNFFLTTEGSTSDKLSNINNIHASNLFSHTSEGHFKNGISGLVTDFNVHRDAEMKAYEFSLKFTAADIIL